MSNFDQYKLRNTPLDEDTWNAVMDHLDARFPPSKNETKLALTNITLQRLQWLSLLTVLLREAWQRESMDLASFSQTKG